jgi:hypothetical protein
MNGEQLTTRAAIAVAIIVGFIIIFANFPVVGALLVALSAALAPWWFFRKRPSEGHIEPAFGAHLKAEPIRRDLDEFKRVGTGRLSEVLIDALDDFYQRHAAALDRGAYLAGARSAMAAVPLVRTYRGLGKPLSSRETRDILGSIVAHLPNVGTLASRAPYTNLPPVPEWYDAAQRQELYREREKFQEVLAAEVGRDFITKSNRIQETLLFPKRNELFSAFGELSVPFHFPDEQRNSGQFVVGAPNMGKTTYLTNLIDADLERVARGDLSIMVIDSKNNLIHHLARLKEFGPGGALDGKLIYLDIDDDHPLALNFFDTKGADPKHKRVLRRSAEQMVNLYLTSVIGAEVSDQQRSLLKRLVRAAMSIDDATIYTLKELMIAPVYSKGQLVKPSGYDRLKDRMRDLPEEDHVWFQNDFYSLSNLGPSRDAISSKLNMFTDDDPFRQMFRHPRNRFNLTELMASSSVILVNVRKDVLRDSKAIYGQYFISKVLQSSEDRAAITDKSQLQQFNLYVDEANEFIAADPNIGEILEKAREQRVAVTVAVQGEHQITNERTRSALNNAALKVELVRQGTAQVSINKAEQITLLSPLNSFSERPKMSEDDFEAIRADMWRRFCVPVDPAAVTPVVQPSISAVSHPDRYDDEDIRFS